MYNLYKEYLEYFDWLDNQILLRSRDRKLEKANKKNENQYLGKMHNLLILICLEM